MLKDRPMGLTLPESKLLSGLGESACIPQVGQESKWLSLPSMQFSF